MKLFIINDDEPLILIFIIIMAFNDSTQQTHTLLLWLNNQLLQLRAPPLQSIQHLKISPSIPHLLKKIVPNLSEFDYFNYQSLIAQLQHHLTDTQDLRLKKQSKQRLHKTSSLPFLLKLLLFISMKSESKNQFVQRIIQMQQNIQTILMEAVQEIDDHLENCQGVKKIYCKVEQFEQENQLLMARIAQMKHHNQKLANQINHQQQIQKSLAQQNKKQQKQKNKVVQKMEISNFKDYLTLYREMENQKKELEINYEAYELQSDQLQNRNRMMGEKIEEDDLIIKHLNQEMKRYHQCYNQNRKELATLECQNSQNLNTSTSTNFLRNSIQKLDHEVTTCSIRLSSQPDEEQCQIDLTKSQNFDILQGQLENIHIQINQLTNQIQVLKKQNTQIDQNNYKKEKKLQKFRKQWNSFQLRYQFTIYE